jgi:hypothetical protein
MVGVEVGLGRKVAVGGFGVLVAGTDVGADVRVEGTFVGVGIAALHPVIMTDVMNKKMTKDLATW